MSKMFWSFIFAGLWIFTKVQSKDFIINKLNKHDDEKINELLINNNINIGKLNKKEQHEVLLYLLTKEYDENIFKNRVSDFFGFITMSVPIVLSILGFILLIILIMLISDRRYDYDGFILPTFIIIFLLEIFGFVIELILLKLCKLFTNRYPYEASRGRARRNSINTFNEINFLNQE